MAKDSRGMRLRRRARKLRRRVSAVIIALRDPATPWYAKLFGVIVVAYAMSPIDLIPDFIPIVGLLDDFVLIPLGIVITLRLIPRDVFLSALRSACKNEHLRTRRLRLAGTAGVITIWLAAAALLAWYAIHR